MDSIERNDTQSESDTVPAKRKQNLPAILVFSAQAVVLIALCFFLWNITWFMRMPKEWPLTQLTVPSKAHIVWWSNIQIGFLPSVSRAFEMPSDVPEHEEAWFIRFASNDDFNEVASHVETCLKPLGYSVMPPSVHKLPGLAVFISPDSKTIVEVEEMGSGSTFLPFLKLGATDYSYWLYEYDLPAEFYARQAQPL